MMNQFDKMDLMKSLFKEKIENYVEKYHIQPNKHILCRQTLTQLSSRADCVENELFLIQQQLSRLNFVYLKTQHPDKYNLFQQIMKQLNKSKQVQDQYLSNEIFFGMVSTFQSIYLYHKKRISEYSNKMFKNYDYMDYRAKTLEELQAQLQSQIIIFKASRFGFKKKYSQQWKLPQKVNRQHLLDFIQNAIDTCRNVKDQISVRLGHDIIRLLAGQFHDLNAETIKINLTYSSDSHNKFRNELVKDSVHVNGHLDSLMKDTQSLESVEDIPFKENPNNPIFTKGRHADFMHLEKKSSDKQQSFIFLAFKESQREKIFNFIRQRPNLVQLLGKCDCHIIQDENQLRESINTLRQYHNDHLIIIFLDSNDKVIGSEHTDIRLSHKEKEDNKTESEQKVIKKLQKLRYSVFFALYTKDIDDISCLKKPFPKLCKSWKEFDPKVEIFKRLDKRFYDILDRTPREHLKGVKLTQIRGVIAKIQIINFRQKSDKAQDKGNSNSELCEIM